MLFEEKLRENARHDLRLFNKYKMLALNMFEWKNLPNGIKPRHIENGLFEYGQVVMFKNKLGKYICLPSTDTGDLDIYGEAKSVNTNGYNFTKRVYLINNEESIVKDMKGITSGVRIINNAMIQPLGYIIRNYANKMYEVEKAINMNVRQQKYPYLVLTDSKNELTMKTLFKKIDEANEFAIYGSKNINMDNISVMNTQTPYVVDKLQQYKYELEREILTEIGLNNTIEKKERLLSEEINSNNDYIYRIVEMMYKSRLEGVELINKIYGLNIEVEKVDNLHYEIDNNFLNEDERSI